MTAEIINLRQERKRREREARAAEAAENRARFGRTLGERERQALDETRTRQNLDAHLRDPAPDTAGEEAPDSTAAETPAPKLP